jgi:hypothetical protein
LQKLNFRKRNDDDTKSGSLPLVVPLVLGTFLAVMLLIGYAEGRLGVPGKLVDSDCYMWLVQTEHWHDGANWYDQSSPRSNAPYGETLHWGKPFEIVLLLPALMLTPFFGFHQALYLWGLAVAPALLIPTAVLLVWGLRPLLTRFQLFLACGLFLSNTAILVNFYPAQPDHKCLNTLLFTAAMGLSIRVLGSQARAIHFVLLGLVFAVGLWSSVEMLFAIGILQMVMVGLWLWHGGVWARRACEVTFSTMVFSSIALLLSRALSTWPHDFENDALSSLHLVLLMLLTIASFIQWKWGPGIKRIGQMALGLISEVIIGGILYRLHPTVFHGPFGDVDPEVRHIWQDKVQDTLPLAGLSMTALATIFYLLGGALSALPAALVLAWKDRSSSQGGWIFLGVNLAASLAVTLFVADRFSTQAALCALGPLAVFLAWLLPEKRLSGAFRLLALMVLGNIGVALSFLLQGIAGRTEAPAQASVAVVTPTPRAVRSMQQLPTVELAQFLNGSSFPAPQRILTFLDLGAELMYRTPHETVATPYHRNTAGILDDFHIMEAQDDATARAIVHQRGVTLILVCPTLDEARTYYEVGTPGTLYERLLKNQPPDWLKPVELPAPLRDDFQLWSVSL